MTHLGSATARDLVDGPSILVVPLGSTEQHGPHLPVSTDSMIAGAWAEAFASGIDTPVAVAPVMVYGAAGEHQSFAGTLSIGTDALVSVLVELARSARHRFDRIIFLSGHAGNLDALDLARQQLTDEGHDIVTVLPVLRGADAHAGRAETSLMLHLAPELVALDHAEAGNTDPIAQLLPAMRSGGTAAVAPNGVLGDPAGASAEEGARLLDELVAHARSVTGL